MSTTTGTGFATIKPCGIPPQVWRIFDDPEAVTTLVRLVSEARNAPDRPRTHKQETITNDRKS